MSNYTRIKRTIQALKFAYPFQEIGKKAVLNCLVNTEFQNKYVNY